tara:strand:- start:14 stop:682 length:669 start_codon:yes stop_codon:yes gene_type:complete
MISIIIPAKNEEKIIYDTVIALQNLRKNKLCEIILVDGMSDDNTINIVRPYIDKVVTCPANRGSQQNLGARISSGQTLVFLHADTHINKKHIEFLSKLKTKQYWGFFKLSFDKKDLKYKILSFFINFRSYLFNYGTGDQVIFIQKELFHKINGFPDFEIMEDINICSKLKKYFNPVISNIYITTSARKWHTEGFLKTIFKMRILRFLYHIKIKPSKLKTYYK